MLGKPVDDAVRTTSRRNFLRLGLGGLAMAGAAAAGFPNPAAAAAGTQAGLTWTGWSPVAPGLTVDTPLACLRGFGNSNLIGFRSMWLFARRTDNRIFSNRSNDDGQSWVGWTEVPGGGLTDRAVGATMSSMGPVLMAKGQDPDKEVWLNWTGDGIAWSGWHSLGGATNVSPTYYIDRAYAVGTDGEMFSNFTRDLSSFAGWALVPGNGLTDAGINVTGFGPSGGALVVFAKGLDSRIYFNPVRTNFNISPRVVGQWAEVPGGGFTDASPTSAAVPVPAPQSSDGCVFVKGYGDQRIWVNRASGGFNFSGRGEVPGGGRTNLAPCATTGASTTRLGPLFLFIVGTDGRPYMNIGS
jgi:hypothetical protein